MSINQVVISGNLTADAELRYSNSGEPMLAFSIAYNKGKDNAHFFDCYYKNQSAPNIAQYLQKGRHVAISGELFQDRRPAQDGSQRNKIGIRVYSVDFSFSNGGGGGHRDWMTGEPMQQQQARPQQQQRYSNSRPAGSAVPAAEMVANVFGGQVVQPQQLAQPAQSSMGFEDDIPF